MFEKLKTCWNLKGGSHIDFQIQCVIMAFLAIPNDVLRTSHSSSYNLTPPISRVLIGPHLIFCSLTSPTCCKSPRKCTPVKYKARQEAGFPIVTETPSIRKEGPLTRDVRWDLRLEIPLLFKTRYPRLLKFWVGPETQDFKREPKSKTQNCWTLDATRDPILNVTDKWDPVRFKTLSI